MHTCMLINRILCVNSLIKKLTWIHLFLLHSAENSKYMMCLRSHQKWMLGTPPVCERVCAFESWFHVCFCFEICKHCQKYQKKQLINKQTMYQCQRRKIVSFNGGTCILYMLQSYNDSSRSRWHFKPFQLSYHFNWVLPVPYNTRVMNGSINSMFFFLVKNTTTTITTTLRTATTTTTKHHKLMVCALSSKNQWIGKRVYVLSSSLILCSNMIHTERARQWAHSTETVEHLYVSLLTLQKTHTHTQVA